MTPNRRDFLLGVAGVSGAAIAGSVIGNNLLAQEPSALRELPSPSESGIDHIVVVMMENRSFDHFMGWLPGARGKQAGLRYPDNSGNLQSTHHLTSYMGCGHPDPDHSYAGGRDEYDDGKMDGWLRTTTNDLYCIGYYEEADLPFWSGFARNFTTLDNYFPSILSSTFPNRVFSWAAQTDRLDNSLSISSLPTIFDSLAAAGISHKYYYQNLPFLALWGTKYITSSELYDLFLIEAELGILPSVSFVDPAFTLIDEGEGNDDHPHADLRAGEAFLGQVYRALTKGSKWKNTLLIVNRDEWGGFFDHIVPPRVVAPNDIDTDLVEGNALLGMRVPVVVASPWSVGTPETPTVNTLLYDHTSVLKLIEWRWGLSPLTRRDASAQINNLAYALNFDSPNYSVPTLAEVPKPAASPCGGDILDNVPATGTGAAEKTDSYYLLKSPLTKGWPLPPGLPE